MNMNDLKSGEPFFREWYIDHYLGTTKNCSVYRIYRDVDGVKEYQLMKVIGIPGGKEELYQVHFDEFDVDSATQYYKELVMDIYREICLLEKIPNKQHIVSYEDHMIFQRGNAVGYDIFIRMELLQGLKDGENYRSLTYRDVILLGKNLCDALSTCSNYHIIHGDIRPDCIYYSETGHYKLGDFAMNRHAGHIKMMETEVNHKYMAPEVAARQTYDTRADIYSLGMVMYECLNNYQLPDTEGTLPIPVNATNELGKVILKACEKDPNKRYQTSEEFKEALTLIGVFLGEYAVEPISADIVKEASQYVAATEEDSFMDEKELDNVDLQKQREEEILEEINLALSRQVQSFENNYKKVKKEEPIQKKKNMGPWVLMVLASVLTLAVIVLLLKSDMIEEDGQQVHLTLAPTQSVTSKEDDTKPPELPITPEVTPEGQESGAPEGTTSPIQQPNETSTTIMLSGQGIVNLSAVEYIENAITIDLSDNLISDLTLLSNAIFVENLKLSNNSIIDITALKDLRTLKVLDLADNSIATAKPLSKLKEIDVLIMSNNLLTNLLGIDQLTNLSYLYLDGNKIEDVSILYQLKELEFLDLSNNPTSQEQIDALSKALPDCIINY